MSETTGLITGATGQDEAYLPRLLLDKGGMAHEVKRGSSTYNTEEVNGPYVHSHENGECYLLHNRGMTDADNLIGLVQETMPDGFYRPAARKHVHVSLEPLEYTANADTIENFLGREHLRNDHKTY